MDHLVIKNKKIKKVKDIRDSRYIYMTLFPEILKIYQEKEFLIKYYVIKPLILLKIQNMMGINEVLFQWFIHFL